MHKKLTIILLACSINCGSDFDNIKWARAQIEQNSRDSLIKLLCKSVYQIFTFNIDSALKHQNNKISIMSTRVVQVEKIEDIGVSRLDFTHYIDKLNKSLIIGSEDLLRCENLNDLLYFLRYTIYDITIVYLLKRCEERVSANANFCAEEQTTNSDESELSLARKITQLLMHIKNNGIIISEQFLETLKINIDFDDTAIAEMYGIDVDKLQEWLNESCLEEKKLYDEVYNVKSYQKNNLKYLNLIFSNICCRWDTIIGGNPELSAGKLSISWKAESGLVDLNIEQNKAILYCKPDEFKSLLQFLQTVYGQCGLIKIKDDRIIRLLEDIEYKVILNQSPEELRDNYNRMIKIYKVKTLSILFIYCVILCILFYFVWFIYIIIIASISLSIASYYWAYIIDEKKAKTHAKHAILANMFGISIDIVKQWISVYSLSVNPDIVKSDNIARIYKKIKSKEYDLAAEIDNNMWNRSAELETLMVESSKLSYRYSSIPQTKDIDVFNICAFNKDFIIHEKHNTLFCKTKDDADNIIYFLKIMIYSKQILDIMRKAANGKFECSDDEWCLAYKILKLWLLITCGYGVIVDLSLCDVARRSRYRIKRYRNNKTRNNAAL